LIVAFVEFAAVADPRFGLNINAYQPISYFCLSDDKSQIKTVEGLKYCEYSDADCRFFYIRDGDTKFNIVDQNSIVRCEITKRGIKELCDDVDVCSHKNLPENIKAALVKSGQEGITIASPRIKQDTAQ